MTSRTWQSARVNGIAARVEKQGAKIETTSFDIIRILQYICLPRRTETKYDTWEISWRPIYVDVQSYSTFWR